MDFSRKKVIKTALLPGIFPRIKNLLGSGTFNLAYLIALVYSTVRILPANHPYLKTENIGTYNIRQTIAAAANHIEPNRNNIDQMLIFVSVIVALVILGIQFVLLTIAIVVPSARAQVEMPNSIAGFFVTPNPQEDIAYRLLDLVFGIPDLFGSKDFSENNLHNALHSLFEFYSLGMLFVAGIIIVYYVIAVVAETAQSGIPFGKRFNKTWAPIRIVLFFALLLPISNGLNGAQYITLTVAKLGSGLASTGWILYNDQITETLTGSVESNIATPTPPDLSYIPAFMLIAKTCQRAYHMNIINAEDFPQSWNSSGEETGIRAWAVYRQREEGTVYNSELMSSTTFQNIAADSGSPSFQIVFGVKDTALYQDNNGGVFPVCGSISFNITDIAEPGSAVIHTAYYDLVKDIWQGDILDINTYAENYVRRYLLTGDNRDLEAPLPDISYRTEWLEYLNEYLGEERAGVVSRAVEAQISGTDWQVSQQIKDYGWGGAGIWYNKIAIQNGALVSALHQIPTIVSYPDIMERVYALNLQEAENISREDYYNDAILRSAPPTPESILGERRISPVLNEVYLYWDGANDLKNIDITPNALINAINVILGTEGLFEMCKNADTHPLAQLSTVGRSMVDSSIRSYVAAGIFSIGSIIPNPFSAAAGAFSSFFGTIGSIGLLIGFILFYVLPFMPFLYFFFAVGGWVKGIFEAMVAMPLWALAHLRIDSESIPGEAALQGYYLIFEIFIRPILIVFGLLASITIFSASVRVLNDIFYLAISNLAGHDAKAGTACFLDAPAADLSGSGPDAVREAVRENYNNQIQKAERGPVDEFAFTILYTIVVYLIGTASFKLIDMLPNNILRWINAEVPSFGDNAGDNAEGLMKYITIAGSQFGGSLSSSIGGVGTGVQGSVTQGISFLNQR